ncbi:MAG: hypothetical protein KJP16_10030 [Gammaproteobacteria bacterium]|nr:hypothetical protein [Gammaproteobacteria bacterium]NNC57788.1 hypothetical protein [Woeseiaceae bacterium]NNL51146.1 hypothetical protein [Woeseiaceae bacterium]
MISNPKTPGTHSYSWVQSTERIIISIFLLLLLIVVVGNTLDIVDESNFHEELRILYHLDPARTNAKDYAGQFLGQFPQPYLYAFATEAALAAGTDLITFHKLLGVVCGFVALVGAALSGLRAGGIMVGLAVALLVAAQPIYHYQISSATPHAFAFPLLTWGLVCLLYERPYMLASLTVLSGLLYPPMSPLLGLMLAWYLLVSRKALSGKNRKRVVDILVLGITAAITVALLWRQLMPIDGYGATLAPGDKIDIYPENGPDGRHFYGVFHPVSYVFASAIGQFRNSLPITLVINISFCIAAVAGLGLYYLRTRTALFRALLAFIIPSVMFCILVTVFRPYMAYRFWLYPLFALYPLLFIYGLFTLCYDHRSTLRYPATAVVAVIVPLILALHATDRHRSFSSLRLNEDTHALMDHVRQLPADTLIAAWPSDEETDLIPYVAGRPLLVNYKAHYPTYEGHIANMRKRTFDLIDAYLAKDVQPLIKLKCRWQTDFLIIDQARFSEDGETLEYFAPFDKHIEGILKSIDKTEMILARPPANAVVFRSGRFTVLDLAALSRGTACPAGQ